MSRRHAVLLAALLALTVAPAASASTFLRTDPFGTTVAIGSTVTSGVGDGISLFVSGGPAISCGSSSLGLTIGTNGGALVTGTLTSLAFVGCTASLGCQKAPGTTVPVTLATTDVVFYDLYLKCVVNAATDKCYYRSPAATGWVDNFLGASLHFNGGVGVTHSPPSGATDDAGAACGTTGSWRPAGSLTSLPASAPRSLASLSRAPDILA
jgi:hypothetical protein